MRLPVSTGVLMGQLVQMREILVKWEGELRAGVPGVDQPGDESSLEEWLQEFCGEMELVSNASAGLSQILGAE